MLFFSASLLWELEEVVWMWRAGLRSAAPWLSPHPSYTRSPALNMSQHIWNVEPPHHTVPDTPQSLLPGARQEIDGPKDFEAARAIRFNNDMMCPDGHRDDILYVGHSQESPFAMVPLCSESKIELASRWMGGKGVSV